MPDLSLLKAATDNYVHYYVLGILNYQGLLSLLSSDVVELRKTPIFYSLVTRILCVCSAGKFVCLLLRWVRLSFESLDQSTVIQEAIREPCIACRSILFWLFVTMSLSFSTHVLTQPRNANYLFTK